MDPEHSEMPEHNEQRAWCTGSVSAGPLDALIYETIKKSGNSNCGFVIRRAPFESRRGKLLKPSDVKWLLTLMERLAEGLIVCCGLDGPVREELVEIAKNLAKMRRRQRRKRR